jgi:hypothetical protein
MRLAINRVLRDRTSKDCTIGIMASVSQYHVNRPLLAEPSATPAFPTYKSDKSATRTDIALLVSALFLQRFSLPFGNKFLMLNFVPVALIILYQFFSGKLRIQYDRLVWFLALGLAVSCSLLLNFDNTMLTAYFLFIVLYSLVILSKPSTSNQYKRTLRGFQCLVILLSYLGVAQFAAQFVIDGRKLIMFYGMVPDFLFGLFYAGGENTIHPLFYGSSILKSNGIFLQEPSIFSQITALGILIEVLKFRRPRYLLVMTLGFLVAYSGTGLALLLLFLPLAGLRHGRAGFSALFVAMFALGLFATGIIDFSAFTSRVGEFQDPRASAFARFVAPLLLAARQFDTGSLQALLVGNGPGTEKNFHDVWYGAASEGWYKLFLDYGMIGSFIFGCFLASCLRRSRCPGLVLAALIVTCLFSVDFVSTPYVTILIVLCTLNGPEAPQSRIDKASGSQPFVASPSWQTRRGPQFEYDV